MPVEMPPIDSNLDTPLPQVDPNSDVVPYRLARQDPGGQQVVTTGYGPRARPPIQPPGGVGAGSPDLSQGITQAFQNLPVDQASKAIEAAIRYQAQRGYMRDLQSGQNAAQAFAKWGPMLFHQATGIPEAIDRSVPTPLTPQQLIQNRLNQQKFDASQATAKAKLDAAAAAAAAKANTPKLHFGASGEVIQETGKPDEPIKVVRKGKDKPDKGATVTVPLNPDNPDGAKITGPADNPDVMEAVKRHEEASKPKPPVQTPGLIDRAKSALGIGGSPTPPQLPPSPAQPPTRVKVKSKDGKVGTIPADQLDKALKQGFTEVK